MTLHTRYRPTKLEDVIGQAGIKKSLKEALAKNASHAFLFFGPSGTGKTTLARIAAGIVGSRPNDIQEIDGATFTGIDDMRSITSTLMYKPLGGAIKSIVVDEAHMLSKAAWNSLLKSVEEPPPWIYWFFCTTEASKIMATIKTRCTSYELKEVDDDELFELLDGVATEEKMLKGIADKDQVAILELCAKESMGSPRQALVNLGKVAICKDRKEAALMLKSAIDSAEAIDLARALLAKEPWVKINAILGKLKEIDPEGIRHIVLRYMANVALGASKEPVVGRAVEIIDAFSFPYAPNFGMAPIVLACGKVVLQ